MKIPYYFGMSLMLLIASASYSYSSYHDTNLVEQIKPKPMARSKPTSVKLASVSFLKSDTGIDFSTGSLDIKSECGALGYAINVSQCTGDMKPSHLCSSEINKTGANQYTTGCCNSKIYTAVNSESCTNNSTALVSDKCYFGNESKWKYRCACDRSRFPFSTITGEGCGATGSFNVNNSCQAYEPSTNKTETYYMGCCPNSYSECNADNHEVGSGNSCRVQSGNTIINKYESCHCASHYDTVCDNGRLIDVSNICRKGNIIYTTESNCESNCTKTSETNLDDYLYQRVWHCLYEKDGATIKTSEGALCAREDVSPSYYDQCVAQGFVKGENDCYNADVVLTCPNDTKRVWCLEGKYCTGYDVGSHYSINYCTDGANVEYCSVTDKGTRCQYKNDVCNCMWSDGSLDTTLTVCQNVFLATADGETEQERRANAQAAAAALFNSNTDNGNDLTCCKRGYKMSMGKCVVNNCDGEKYPYAQRPGDEMGEVEFCYKGDVEANLGYKAYFGYASCKSDPAKGEKWLPKGESGAEARQCVCAREGELGGAKLPFGVELFFDSNNDETDSYTHVGFSQGTYGTAVDCTDAEASYYGYSSCFIGSKMRKVSSEPTGQCLKSGQNGSYSYSFPHYNTDTQGRNNANRILNAAGLSSIGQASRPVTNKMGDASKVYCVNPTQHCPNGNAEQCDESVKPLLISGCTHGWEEECSMKCYHKASLIQENGVYKLNTKGLKMIVNTFDNGTISFGFEACPTGFIKTSGSYNTCFKFCSIENKGACEFGDVLTLYTESELFNNDGSSKFTAGTIDKSKIVGVVFARDGRPSTSCGTSGKLHVASIKYKSLNYTDAQAYSTSSEFQTAVGNTIYALGTWRMPTTTEMGSGCLSQFGAYESEGMMGSLSGSASMTNLWTSTSGVYRNCCGTSNSPTTTSRIARPVVEIAY